MPSKSNREEDIEDEEEEELSYTGEEEEEEEDDEGEAEVRKDRSTRKKAKSRSRKRGSASAFLDVAAEEDEDEEDEEGDRRQKRSRFIDDIAEVDEEEEEDELEEEGLEDLIDDAGEQAQDAVDMVALRRQMREAEAQAAQDAELNPEALQEYLKNRYGGQARQYYGGGGPETELGAVAQQALLPKASDPKLWVVRCAEGAEREIVVCLLQKAYDLAQRSRPLLVKSAFCQEHLKGYLYVEAFKEAHVSEALKGLRAIFQSRKPRMVPLDEMTAALAVQAPKIKAIDAGSWVRVKVGVYKNDLAHVVDLDASGERASIKLVPRLDLAALDSRSTGRGSGPNKQATISRPPPKAFNPDEARQFRSLDVLAQRDRTTGELVHVLNGTQRFQEGYLVKSVALKSLILVEGVPPLDELQRFQAASTGGGGKGSGTAGGNAGTEDLASLVQSLSTTETSSAVPLFQKGDMVMVVQGDLAGIQGRVEGTGEGSLIMVRPEDAKLPGFTELVGFQPRELQKHFDPGTHVRAGSGSHTGETGMVVSSTGGVVTVFTDVSREEIRVLARDLVPAAAVASAALDTLGTYELHDLVALDATTVGVIVGIDDKDTCRVLTNQGRPEKPDVRVCRLPDLKRKLNNRRAAAQDGARNEVAVGDIVEVVDGPLRGRSGTVRYVVRGLLFVQSREIPDNGGFACVQARHCRVRGGRKPVSASNPLATPARHSTTDGFFGSSYNPPGGVLASPARQGGGGFGNSFGTQTMGPYGASSRITTSADRLLEGRMITIRQGPHRGMRGRVVSCTPTHLRLELEAQMKTVTVDRSHVAEEDGGVRRSDTGFGGGFNGVGATPARVGATPARWAGATPLRPTATPVREALTRTPAYDPAWAATPAHPGFGSQTGGNLPPSPRRDTPSTARYHADTPGSSYIPPTTRVDPYLAAPSPYSPSPALTPGLAALTPGLSYPDPGVVNTITATTTTTMKNTSLPLCWKGVEVSLDAGRGVVESVDASTGRATVLRGTGTESSWSYDNGNETVQVPVADLEPVAPQRGDTVKLLQGDLAGKSGELVGTDGGDGIIKLGPEIKIWELANVGRVVPGFDGSYYSSAPSGRRRNMLSLPPRWAPPMTPASETAEYNPFVDPNLIRSSQGGAVSGGSSIGFTTGGAQDVENFRENLNNSHLPIVSDITFTGIVKGYYFDTTGSTNQSCTDLFCPMYSLGLSQPPALVQAADGPQDLNNSTDIYMAVGLDSGIQDFKRKKLNLVLLLDVSGSMSSPFNAYYYDQFGKRVELTPEERTKTKLDVAKEVLTGVLDQLSPDDRVSIVLFSDEACTALPLSPVDCLPLNDLKEAINRDIQPLASTNIEAGLNMSIDVLEGCRECMKTDPNEWENRVIVLTDAEINTGDITSAGLKSLVEAASQNKIFFTYIGIGLDFATNLIEIMSQVPGTNYLSVHSPGEFQKRVVQQFEYIVTPLVFDLTLEIRSPDGLGSEQGWRMLQVYGSPNDDSTLTTDGSLMKINTLFPSPKEENAIKGGVVLVRLRAPESSNTPLQLVASYKDRQAFVLGGEAKQVDRTLSVNDLTALTASGSTYQSTGVRKAILLARYTDLLRSWLVDQWEAYGNRSEPVPIPQPLCDEGFPTLFCPPPILAPLGLEDCRLQRWTDAGACIIPVPIPIERELTEWERMSAPLKVGEEAKSAFRDFLPYFIAESAAVGDNSLSQEADILRQLIASPT